MTRVVVCGASGTEERHPDWAALDPGEDPSHGAQLALLGGAESVLVLLVELEAGGLVALHATADVSVCYVVKGGGTVFFPNRDDVPFNEGDTIEFAAGVVHGWRGGSERTLVAVTTFPPIS